MDCIEKNFPWAAEFHLDTPCWNERTNAFYKRLGYRIIKIEDGFVFYRKRKSEPHTIQNFTESKLLVCEGLRFSDGETDREYDPLC